LAVIEVLTKFLRGALWANDVYASDVAASRSFRMQMIVQALLLILDVPVAARTPSMKPLRDAR
jgi:hypothetical protein